MDVQIKIRSDQSLLDSLFLHKLGKVARRPFLVFPTLLVYNPPYTVLYSGCMKVHQQTQFVTSELEIG